MATKRSRRRRLAPGGSGGSERACAGCSPQLWADLSACHGLFVRYTKVNRCLTEGRRRLLERVAGIEAGAECERLAPLLSALADGEAGADAVAALRPHLRSCLNCRARLREYRAAPARVAALVPLGAMAPQGDGSGALRGFVESLVGAAQDKAAALGERAHAAAELATGQKLAAVAASTAALAGGGAATVNELGGDKSMPGHEPAAQVQPAGQEPPAQAAPGPDASGEAAGAAPPAPPEPRQAEPPPPDPANEFAPEAAPTPAPASRGEEPANAGFAPGGGGVGSGSAGGGSGEFGP